MDINTNQFTSLNLETRTTLPTDAAAYHLNRKPQTLRSWACNEKGPLRPLRINGRLAWSVAKIRLILEVEST
ncbi:MAG: DNA-binding protein [Legionella sp.]|nr:DNA-binding protein [Legionella sp.]